MVKSLVWTSSIAIKKVQLTTKELKNHLLFTQQTDFSRKTAQFKFRGRWNINIK